VKTLCIERRSLLLAAWAAATASATLPVRAAGFDLQALAALLAQRKSAEARFTEERFVSGIEGPLRASGVLSFSAPGRFERRTLEPTQESMAVDGNTITLKRGGRSRQMAMDAVPEVGALLEAVRGTLTGNAVTLDKHFTTRVEGTAARWLLTLVPRDARLASQVRELQIAGLQSDVRSVALWLAGGDHSVMAIEPPLAATAPAAGK
jgi:hypothetical protein